MNPVIFWVELRKETALKLTKVVTKCKLMMIFSYLREDGEFRAKLTNSLYKCQLSEV